MESKKTVTFDLDELNKILAEESGHDYTNGPVAFGTWRIDPEGNLVEIGHDTFDDDNNPVEKTRKTLIKGRISGVDGKTARARWLIDRVDKQLGWVMDARTKLGIAEEGLRDVSTEMRGELRAWSWCCMNPDIDITIDPMKKESDGTVVNIYGVYNHYKCKNCGKEWIEQVSPGPGYASISDIDKKEIEDYHKGYITKPKLRCPVCHDAGIHVVIVNENKKTHHYEIHCTECGWKSDDIGHSWGYLKKKDDEKQCE
jgi:predicted RNA-binding Zn-ribbon protein involved in translation (DUF1610 family)